jgi:long-chain acyl-CoA synthetase
MSGHGHENGVNGVSNGVHKAGITTPTLDPSAMYAGARLVILGGTGFLGKVFWCMLLDRYPEVGKIFLLVRSNAVQTSEQRFWSQVATSEALQPLRDRYGDGFEAFLREKFVPVDGDMGLPCCGIAKGVIAELRGTIDAVVNVAGVVDFNPPLDESIEANAFGAQNLVALCKELGGAPLMHTSTCYVCGDREGYVPEVDPFERPFPRVGELPMEAWDPNREISECLELIAQAKHRAEDAFRVSEFSETAKAGLEKRGEPQHGAPFEAELLRVKRKWIEAQLVESGLDRATHWGWPNIYTYTKSIGEQVVTRSGLPFTIVRPACCETCIEFPFPGWNEGIGTSAPITYLIMKGQMVIPADHTVLDFIPTDMVCAGMLIALAELLEGSQKPVYQFGVSDTNPATAVRLGELIGLYKRKHFQRKGKGNPLWNFLQGHLEPVFVSRETFEQTSSPAISKASRALAGLLKQAPALRPMAKALEGIAYQEDKIADILRLFAPFMSMNKGPFSSANVRAAYARLSDADKVKLPWRPESIDWVHWMHDINLPGMEKRVLPVLEKKLTKELQAHKAHETLVTLVAEMAERHDLGLALQRMEQDGLSRVTYADVLARSNAVAARLAEAGIAKGDRVALCAPNHPDWAIAYFGIMRAGAVAVPMDPAMDDAARANVLRESGAKVVLDEENLHGFTEEDSSLVPPVVEVGPGDVASLIYTSGTTGTPKGVRLTHGNFVSLIASLAPIFPLNGGDRVLSVLPLHHTFEFTCGLLLPFSRGARIVYLDELNGERVTAGLKAGRITAMVGVPALWQLLERRIVAQVKEKGPAVEMVFHWAAELNRLIGKNLGIDAGRVLFGAVHEGLGGNIKYLISGGAALPKDTQKLFAGLGLHLAEGYGLTEASPVLTVAKSSPRSPSGQVGKPIPGVKIKIHEPDESGVGEVLAQGPNIMAGYTDDAATAEVMTADGWLKTGDLGKLDRQGRLVIVGRSKDVIVTASGENVYPDDVEAKLGKVAYIEELALVGVDAPSGGERIACLAVPAKADDVDRGARLDRASKSLRDAFGKLPYGLQPAVVHFVDAPLPRTATRKVKRKEVRQILLRTIAATSRPQDDSAHVSGVKRAIAAVRAKDVTEIASGMALLGDLGFDSLTMTELLVALEAKYGAVEPSDLHACLTVHDVEVLVQGRKSIVPSRTKTIEGREKAENKRGIELASELPEEVKDFGKRLIGKAQDAFYGSVMTSKVYGRAFIPHNRNTIVVSNHASHLDMGFVRHALGKYGEDIVSLAAQDYFFEGNGIRKVFFENFTNLRALDRKGTLRQAERQAAQVLEEGRTMLVFPEGTRSPDGEVQEFKPLVGHLAMHYGVDILPVYLSGTRDALPKGSVLLPRKRDITARIGPPLCVQDLQRMTLGMTPADAAREAAKLARLAVVALRDGRAFDLSRMIPRGDEPEAEIVHPLVTLFTELGTKFMPKAVDRPVSYYFTLGADAQAKWTVKVSSETCEIKAGKPDGGTADCVLKTSAEIFTKIVRESYMPGAAEFLSGAIKSNDVELLQTFQKVFNL